MRTIKPVASGEELLNDYGPLPRSELLLRYGYVTSRYAQYDVVIFSFEDCLKAAGHAEGEPPEALVCCWSQGFRQLTILTHVSA